MAKPSKWNQELVDAICEELADGKSQRIIFARRRCRDVPVLRWFAQKETLRSQHAHAREAHADALAEEIPDIAARQCWASG